MVRGHGGRAGGKYHHLLSGEVMGDTGDLYDTVQAAVDASDSYALVGVGEFDETVTVDVPGFTLDGFGRASHVDPSSGPGIEPVSSDVTIRDLRVSGDKSNSKAAIEGDGHSGEIRGVYAHDAEDGIYLTGEAQDWDVVDCEVANVNEKGIKTVPGSTIENCRIDGARIGVSPAGDTIVQDCVADDVDYGISDSKDGIHVDNFRVFSPNNVGIELIGDDCTIEGCFVRGSGGNGITYSGNDGIVSSNKVHTAGADGIEVGGADVTILGNRVGGSAGTDLNTSSATNPTKVGNTTGALNG